MVHATTRAGVRKLLARVLCSLLLLAQRGLIGGCSETLFSHATVAGIWEYYLFTSGLVALRCV